MPFFHITYDDGKIRHASALRQRHRLPVPGQRLVVEKPFKTPAGLFYDEGDVLELVERTDEAPHHVRCSLGNWRVKDKHLTSVWSNIEYAMNEGILVFHQDE